MAVAKPRNLAEQARVERELARKYPQMLTRAFKKRVAKARKKSGRTETVGRQTGLTKSELDKFR